MDPASVAIALTGTPAVLAMGAAALPVSPVSLAAMVGVAASHLAEPSTKGMNDYLKPIVAVATPAVAATVAALSSGTPLPAAVGYGAVTAVGAIASHWAFFSSTGFSSFMAGVINALNKTAAPATDSPAKDSPKQ